MINKKLISLVAIVVLIWTASVATACTNDIYAIEATDITYSAPIKDNNLDVEIIRPFDGAETNMNTYTITTTNAPTTTTTAVPTTTTSVYDGFLPMVPMPDDDVSEIISNEDIILPNDGFGTEVSMPD